MKVVLVLALLTGVFFACQPDQNKKIEVKTISKKKGIMEEYKAMKQKLEPQGYIITTDSVDKIFIDNSVTINYNKQRKK